MENFRSKQYENLDFEGVVSMEDKMKSKIKEESEYKLIVHPSVINYDYRIAWTWDEMEKRNKSNIEKDKRRGAFGMPTRAYGEHKEWTNHYCNNKPLEFNEWW